MKNINNIHLLLESEYLPRWKAITIQTLVDETSAEITHIIVNEVENKRMLREQVKRFFDLGLWGPIAAYHYFRSPPTYAESIPIKNIDALRNIPIFHTKPVPRDSFGNELPADAVALLNDADLAVRMGFGILTGDALIAPEKGVLSFHHGDLRTYRGQPAGFWEFLHNKNYGTITVQRINETLDGGEIIAEKKVDIREANSWPEVRKCLYTNSHDMLANAKQNIENPAKESIKPEELGTLYSHPDGLDAIRYLVKSFEI